MKSRWWRRTAALLAVLAVAAAVTYLVRAPLLRAIGHQLVHADVPSDSDAILVLAGGSFDRELEAADLFARGLAPRVLMTREAEAPVIGTLRARGVAVEPVLDLRRRVLTELGVPPDRITVLDDIVSSTHDEAEGARRWMAGAGATRLIVVTSSFHTARTRYIFRTVLRGAGIRLQLVPASAGNFDPDAWWTSRVTLREGLFEWQKMVFYRLWY